MGIYWFRNYELAKARFRVLLLKSEETELHFVMHDIIDGTTARIFLNHNPLTPEIGVPFPWIIFLYVVFFTNSVSAPTGYNFWQFRTLRTYSSMLNLMCKAINGTGYVRCVKTIFCRNTWKFTNHNTCYLLSGRICDGFPDIMWQQR